VKENRVRTLLGWRELSHSSRSAFDRVANGIQAAVIVRVCRANPARNASRKARLPAGSSHDQVSLVPRP
jgi:hypothetical protein